MPEPSSDATDEGGAQDSPATTPVVGSPSLQGTQGAALRNGLANRPNRR
jgi:hypothetical protein